MSHVEGTNRPRFLRVGQFVHSKKAQIGILGILALFITPAAVLALTDHSSPVNNNTTTSGTTADSNSTTSPTEPSVSSVSTSTTPSGNGQSTTQVTVNGEAVEVPTNGSIHKTITTSNGQTTVDVSNSSSNSSSSSTNVQVNSSSYSSTTANGSHVSQGGSGQ